MFQGDIDVGDVVMFGFLVLAALVIISSLWRAHRANGTSYYNQFNLIDLITTREGRVDRPAFLEVGTWMIVVWGFIVLVTKAQWGLLVAYGGMMTGVFVLRAGHAAYLKSCEGKPPEEPKP